jgi:hypothetical protein
MRERVGDYGNKQYSVSGYALLSAIYTRKRRLFGAVGRAGVFARRFFPV